MPAGAVGTARQALILTTVACMHIAAASSAAGGLSAVPLNFQGDRSDWNAGLQAWGHLLGSAVLFNKVPGTSPYTSHITGSMHILHTSAHTHTVP